jgi:hypothetical protein
MLHDDHENEHLTIAAENGYDMIGFIADYTHYEPQDERINDEFIVDMYDIICCKDLIEAVGAIMRLNEFSFDDLLDYNDQNYSPMVH